MTYGTPGYSPGPFDYNRASRKDSRWEGTVCPPSLRWAYWVLVAAAVVMLTSGLVAFFGGQSAGMPAGDQLFVAVSNVVGALVIAVAAAQLSGGNKWARRVCTTAAALCIFFNVAALALGVGGIALLLIPILLAVAILLMFRPTANEFIREQN